MKTVCIYHSIDLDGWMSAAIVKHWFKYQDTTDGIVEINNKVVINGAYTNKIQELYFIGYNYGQPIPDLSEYDRVIMCDISFPKDEMSKLWHNLSLELIWIDHHKSAINDNNDLVWIHKGLQDTNYAACELTWKYFFPNEQMPEIVRLLGRYDCFGHKGTDEETKVLEFQYGARQCISNYEEAYSELTKTDSDTIGELTNLEKIHRQGKAIYQYLCTEAKQSYKNGFEVMFYWAEPKNYGNINNPKQCSAKFICINKERFNPINFGIDYHKDGYDGCACFHFDGKQYMFSLYNDNDLVDCSVIAKQFGGGGHKGAAGFRIKDLKELGL